jgi:hypothetical protein
MSSTEIQQITLKQIISLVGLVNVSEIWSVTVNNTTNVKHYIVLLMNNSYICTCLSIVQQGIVCRHYFQVMLTTNNAKFHIRLIPSRWYYKDLDGSREPFFTADKFCNENLVSIQQESSIHINYLCAFSQDNEDFLEKSLTVLQQKKIYGELHGIYKKALQKALQNKAKSEQLIELLKEFTEGCDEEYEDESDSDKENENSMLLNPKKRQGKGRPLGTKRFRSSIENKHKDKRQRHCKKCGNVGHYQKNCKVSD